MSTMRLIFLAVFLIALALLVWNLYVLSLVRKLNETVEEIRLGNLNQRFRLRTAPTEFANFSGNLNRLLDQFQATFERAEYLEEERRKMIANISHDLRTPLTSMLGYIEALQIDPGLSSQERENYLEVIAGKGDVLAHLIQDFFELMKLESDDPLIKLDKLDLSDLLQQAVVGFYQEFAQCNITPDLALTEGPVYVLGNYQSIERILNNLLSNALRYGFEGKAIGVRLWEEENLAWVEVWDKGRGISEDDLPHIFDRLYTGEHSRNPSLQGSGLGLTIAKKLVEKMRGNITVSSTPWHKTSFAFCLEKVRNS